MEQKPQTRPLVDYPTRVDRFRVRHAIDHRQWAAEAGIRRTSLNRIRKGADITLEALVRIVRAASRILGRPVRASELYDLGESAAVSDAEPVRHTSKKTRKEYDSPMDRLLLARGIPPARLARRTGLTRQTLRRIRKNLQSPSVSTAAAIIRALRELGVDVNASDLWDVGEDQSRDDVERG
jgi:DNA-binding XRE family transcriptional regulator